MTYAKPWETKTKRQQASAEVVQGATAKPWEPAPPKVAPEILQSHQATQASRGRSIAIDAHQAQAFAKSYLIDFDAIAAQWRLGWVDEDTPPPTARNRGYALKNHPLVQEALKGYLDRLTESDIVSRNRVLMGLLEEANYKDSGASHSARVAAWGKLATLLGFEAEKPKGENEDAKLPAGGVLLIPYQPNIEDWEASAMGQQKQLKADVRS